MMSSVIARSAGRFARNCSIAVQSRSVSSGDRQARADPNDTRKGISNAEKPRIKQLINEDANSKEPSFRGAEEIVDEAYKRGGIKDGGLDKGPTQYKPVPGNQTNAEKDPVGRRKFSTIATLQVQSKATYATKTPSKETDSTTGGRGMKVDHDVDYDQKKGPDGKAVKPGMKSPVGQVIGKEGLESTDGGKHQDSSDKLQNKERKPSAGRTTTGAKGY